MSVLVAVAYMLVGVGVFTGRSKKHGDGFFMALGVAIVWPVLVLIGWGNEVA